MHDGAYDRYLSTVRGLMEKVSKEEVEAAAAYSSKRSKTITWFILGTSGHAYMARRRCFTGRG